MKEDDIASLSASILSTTKHLTDLRELDTFLRKSVSHVDMSNDGLEFMELSKTPDAEEWKNPEFALNYPFLFQFIQKMELNSLNGEVIDFKKEKRKIRKLQVALGTTIFASIAWVALVWGFGNQLQKKSEEGFVKIEDNLGR